MAISHVWYASYGSNMNRNRFSHYIVGGRLSGTPRTYKGCDDKTLPAGDTLVELPHGLYFAGESSVWTGGIAFVGLSPSRARTKSRAYLITLRQFEQITAQENRREWDDAQSVDVSLLRSVGHFTLGVGNYSEILYCGEKDGFPIITCTSPSINRPYTKPAPLYLKMIASGLRDFHGLTDQEMVDYLITKPGIAGNYSYRELDVIIR